jgi:hypothetical protein
LSNPHNVLSPNTKEKIIPEILLSFTQIKHTKPIEAFINDLVQISINEGASLNSSVNINSYHPRSCLEVAIIQGWQLITTTLLKHTKFVYDTDGNMISFVEADGSYHDILLPIFRTNPELFSQQEVIQLYARNGCFVELSSVLSANNSVLSEYNQQHIIFDIIYALYRSSYKLHNVTEEEANQVVILSIAKGAKIDVERYTSSHITPLMIVAEKNFQLLFFTFLDYGARIDLKDCQKHNAFIYAFRSKHQDLCIKIIERYPDILANSDQEFLICHSALNQQYLLCKNILEGLGEIKLSHQIAHRIPFSIIDSISNPETEQSALELLQITLGKGANLSAIRNNGETTLMAAVAKKLDKIIKFLCNNGVDIYAKNHYGVTVKSYSSEETWELIQEEATNTNGEIIGYLGESE